MAKKNKLTSSFGTARKRSKPSLDEIDKIASATEPTSPAPSTSTAPAAAPKKSAAPKQPAPKPAAAKAPATRRKPAAPNAAPVPEVPADTVMKKTSVDLPLELYQELKIHLIRKQLKFREYLTDLIERDLKKHR